MRCITKSDGEDETKKRHGRNGKPGPIPRGESKLYRPARDSLDSLDIGATNIALLVIELIDSYSVLAAPAKSPEVWFVEKMGEE